MPEVRVLVLRAAGTNCDMETAYAFEKAGGKPDRVHINRLASGEVKLSDYQILAIPGGFTYGDDISAGKVLANELNHRLAGEMARFVESDRLIIGICNGFQVLVKMGLLPGWPSRQATLTYNDSFRYEDRWVHLKVTSTKSPFFRSKEVLYMPVAHGEGKFVVDDPATLTRLEKEGQVVVKYCDERGGEVAYPGCPNGSVGCVAGISSPSGRIFGLMPHPERNIEKYHHPRWTRGPAKGQCDGLKVFKNAVNYFS